MVLTPSTGEHTPGALDPVRQRSSPGRPVGVGPSQVEHELLVGERHHRGIDRDDPSQDLRDSLWSTRFDGQGHGVAKAPSRPMIGMLGLSGRDAVRSRDERCRRFQITNHNLNT